MNSPALFITVNIHPNYGGLRHCYRAVDILGISESSLGNGILHIGNPQTGKVEQVMSTTESYDELVNLLSMTDTAIHEITTHNDQNG